MKKICYLINSDWYFHLHWIDRAREAKNSGFEVFILANFRNEKLVEKLTVEGFKCIDTRIKERSINPIGFILDAIRCYKIIKKIKPDLLISITIKCLVIGGVYSRLTKNRVLLNFVGLGRIFNSRSIIDRVLKILVKPCIKWIIKYEKSYLCFEHEYDKQNLLKEVGFQTERAFVINGAGVDCDVFKIQPEPETKEITILYASRLIKRKGLPDLVQVVSELREELNIKINLKVAGINVPDDPDAISHTAISEWHRNNQIQWLGKSDEIPKLLAACHIVALPSTYPEGVPRILLESFASGRPAITYDIDGCRSLISHKLNGILVRTGDLAEFKERIRELILNKELRLMLGNSARKTAVERYSSKIIINETICLYNNIMSENHNHVRK